MKNITQEKLNLLDLHQQATELAQKVSRFKKFYFYETGRYYGDFTRR